MTPARALLGCQSNPSDRPGITADTTSCAELPLGVHHRARLNHSTSGEPGKTGKGHRVQSGCRGSCSGRTRCITL
jgi:hypothetical protein